VQQSDVSLATVHGHAHSDRPAVRVPDNAARGLGRQHADAVHAQTLCRGKKSRATMPSGLFVGDEDQTNASVERHLKPL
jgi:hypothetical protein